VALRDAGIPIDLETKAWMTELSEWAPTAASGGANDEAPTFDAVDTNHDGVVSRDEYNAALHPEEASASPEEPPAAPTGASFPAEQAAAAEPADTDKENVPVAVNRAPEEKPAGDHSAAGAAGELHLRLAGDAAAQQAVLAQVWARADADGSGALDKGELRTVLVQMGNNEADIDIDAVMALVDVDGDGDVSLKEFGAWFLAQGAEAQDHLFVIHYEARDGTQVRPTRMCHNHDCISRRLSSSHQNTQRCILSAAARFTRAGRAQAEAVMSELPALLAAGALTAQTQVWMDGLADWMPMGEAQQLGAGGSAGTLAALKSSLHEAPAGACTGVTSDTICQEWRVSTTQCLFARPV
jgi:hypothetical protein